MAFTFLLTPWLRYVDLSALLKRYRWCIALKQQTPNRATEHHLPYGITQCYLPPDTGERASP